MSSWPTRCSLHSGMLLSRDRICATSGDQSALRRACASVDRLPCISFRNFTSREIALACLPWFWCRTSPGPETPSASYGAACRQYSSANLSAMSWIGSASSRLESSPRSIASSTSATNSAYLYVATNEPSARMRSTLAMNRIWSAGDGREVSVGR